MNIRVFEAFAGYGSQCLALNRLSIPYTLVGYSEIDPSAIIAHGALHPGAKNYGDITKIDWQQVPSFDLFTYSFPCTDISAAGQQKGLSKGSGTRSSLLWECERAIRIKRPSYLLMENVKALVSKKFIKDFHEWLAILDNLGYVSFSKVINASECGVPQNRERIFVVSIIKNRCETAYHFPSPIPLEKALADVLDENVPDKYFLSEEMLARFCDKALQENVRIK